MPAARGIVNTVIKAKGKKPAVKAEEKTSTKRNKCSCDQENTWCLIQGHEFAKFMKKEGISI